MYANSNTQALIVLLRFCFLTIFRTVAGQNIQTQNTQAQNTQTQNTQSPKIPNPKIPKAKIPNVPKYPRLKEPY